MRLKVQKLAQLTGHEGSIFGMAAAKEEFHIYSSGGDGWIVEWNLLQPDLGHLIAKVPVQVFALAYHPDLKLIVAGDMNGGMHFINLERPQEPQNFLHHKKGVFQVFFVGDKLYSLGGDGMFTRWNVDTNRPEASLQVSSTSLRSFTLPSQNQALIGDSLGKIYRVDYENMKVLHTSEKAHDKSVFSLAFAKKERAIFSGGRDAHIKKWTAIMEETEDVFAHNYTVNSLLLSPDEKYLISASRDKTIRIWDAGNLELLKAIEMNRDHGHFNSVNRLLWVKGSKDQFLSAGDDQTIIHWQIG